MAETVHTAPKPFVFVLMPFATEFTDVYQLGIKAACDEAGAYCERVDEQHFDGGMLQRIYNQISKADFVIADMSGKNANVFYEVGYSHALDKRVILITNNSADIPFDLKNFPHIVYSNVTALKSELKKRIEWAITNPKSVSDYFEDSMEIFLDRTPITPNCVINIDEDGHTVSMGGFFLPIHIHNVANKVLKTTGFQIGFITSDKCHSLNFWNDYHGSQRFPTKEILRPNGTKVYINENGYTVLPDSWESILVRMRYDIDETLDIITYPMTLKLYMETGVKTFPFELNIKKAEAKTV